MSKRKKFKDEFPFEVRLNQVRTIKLKYPDRYPILVERADDCKLNDISKRKYLVPGDLTVGQLIYTIRKSIKLQENEALFCFFANRYQLPVAR